MPPLELFLCLFGGGFGDLMNKNSKGINYTFNQDRISIHSKCRARASQSQGGEPADREFDFNITSQYSIRNTVQEKENNQSSQGNIEAPEEEPNV